MQGTNESRKMRREIELRLSNTAVDDTRGDAQGLRQRMACEITDAPIPSRAAQVVDRVVACWWNLAGLKLNRMVVFDHMEKLRAWNTRAMKRPEPRRSRKVAGDVR